MENERYFQKLTRGRQWKIMRIIAFTGIALCAILFFEPLLPGHYYQDTVARYSKSHYLGLDGKRVVLVQMQSGDRYFLKNPSYVIFSENPQVYVQTTWVTHNPVGLIALSSTRQIPIAMHFSFGTQNLLFGLLFLVPALTMLYKRRTILFSVLYQISFYGIGGIIIYFLIANDRIMHLITLGYL